MSLTRSHGWIVSLGVMLIIGLAMTAGDATASPVHHAHHHLDSEPSPNESRAASVELNGPAKHARHADDGSHCWAYATCSPVVLPAFIDPVGRHVAFAWPADQAVDLVSLAFQPLDPPPRS